METEDGEKNRSPIVTLADAALCAFGVELADAAAVGSAAGTPRAPAEPLSEGLDGVRRGAPADDPTGDASGVVVTGAGSVGYGVVAVVVVVAPVVVPASCAAEIAGMAQLTTRRSIPLASALAPFIARILRPSPVRGTGLSSFRIAGFAMKRVALTRTLASTQAR